VRRQSALGIFRPVLDAPLGREPRQGTGRHRRWPRPRSDRIAAARGAGAGRAAATARRRRPVGEHRRCAGAARQSLGKRSRWRVTTRSPVGTLSAAPTADATASAVTRAALSTGPPADRSRRARRPLGQARRLDETTRSVRAAQWDPCPLCGRGSPRCHSAGKRSYRNGAIAPLCTIIRRQKYFAWGCSSEKRSRRKSFHHHLWK
jgi:hypothetical protein